MTHRSNKRGTPILDRLFGKVGRVRVASGTRSKPMVRKLNDMLSAFRDMGRADLLEAIRDHTVSPLYAFSRYRQGRLDEIPAGDVLPALGAAWDAWAKRLDCSPSYRTSLRRTRRALGLSEEHILIDLPARLRAYRETAPPDSSNQARVHALAFLRDTLGKSHRLWMAVRDMKPAKKKPRQPRQIPSVEEVRQLVVQLGPKAGGACWSLAAMGMIPKEYWEDGWEELPDRIRSYGQKRAGRTRDIPRWTRVVQPPLSFTTFRRKLRAASEGKWRPTDFRRAFARWMAEAGVSPMNQRLYMGHGARNMSQWYTDGEVTAQLDADAEKIRAHTAVREPLLLPRPGH